MRLSRSWLCTSCAVVFSFMALMLAARRSNFLSVLPWAVVKSQSNDLHDEVFGERRHYALHHLEHRLGKTNLSSPSSTSASPSCPPAGRSSSNVMPAAVGAADGSEARNSQGSPLRSTR